MTRKTLLSLLLMTVTATSASAQILVPWGTHDPGELGGTLFFGTGSSFPYETIYRFTLAQPGSLDATAVTNDAPGVFDINGQAIRLYKDNGDTNFTNDVLVGGFTVDSTSVVGSFSSLEAGDYYYKATGNVDGPFGGSYLISSGATKPTAPLAGPPPAQPSGPGTVVPWGVHDSAELDGTLFFGTGSSFPFAVGYTFSLGSTSNLLAVATSNDGASFDIGSASVRLYTDNGNADWSDDTLVGGFTFDSTSITTTFSGIVAGNYRYQVIGNVDGALGGSYLFSSHAQASAAPAPEPATIALLGLGLAGLAASRRRKQ